MRSKQPNHLRQFIVQQKTAMSRREKLKGKKRERNNEQRSLQTDCYCCKLLSPLCGGANSIKMLRRMTPDECVAWCRNRRNSKYKKLIQIVNASKCPRSVDTRVRSVYVCVCVLYLCRMANAHTVRTTCTEYTDQSTCNYMQ